MKRIISITAEIAICAVMLCSCGNQTLKATYTFGEDGNKSQITLNEDGTFEFVFSPSSSYLGIGKFTKEGDRLMLETSDGKYHYVFRITEEGLVYDDEASSGMHWFGDFSDGSLFENNK